MTGFSNPEVWEMLGRLLPCCCLSPALTHPKDSSTALPLAISAAGGSQSDLERSRGSGDLPLDPEMSGIPSLIPLCLFRAPRAAFTWWHCQEAAGGFSTAVPVTGSGSPWCTRCSVCLRKGWTSRLSFKARHRSGKVSSGSLAEAELFSWADLRDRPVPKVAWSPVMWAPDNLTWTGLGRRLLSLESTNRYYQCKRWCWHRFHPGGDWVLLLDAVMQYLVL